MGKLIENHPSTIGRWIDTGPLEELELRQVPFFEAPLDPYEEGYVEPTFLDTPASDHVEPLGTEEGLLTSEGAILLGVRVSCVSCQHRMDPRPWWRRLLFKAKAEVFRCTNRGRVAIPNPVTGKLNYTNNIFCTPSRGMESPFERCVDTNPYGFCESFKGLP